MKNCVKKCKEDLGNLHTAVFSSFEISVVLVDVSLRLCTDSDVNNCESRFNI